MFKKLLLSFLSVLLMATPVSAAVTTSKLKNNLRVTGNATIDGTSTLTGNVSAAGTLAVTGNATIGGTLGVTGAITPTVPLTVAAVNNAIESKLINVTIGAGTALADSTAYYALVAPGRACTITKISIAASTKPAGGTNTVAIEKNGTTTVLNAATFDPTTIAADNTSQALTLTGTGANLALASTDVLKITWTTGVQTTDAIAPVITVEVNNSADY